MENHLDIFHSTASSRTSKPTWLDDEPSKASKPAISHQQPQSYKKPSFLLDDDETEDMQSHNDANLSVLDILNSSASAKPSIVIDAETTSTLRVPATSPVSDPIANSSVLPAPTPGAAYPILASRIPVNSGVPSIVPSPSKSVLVLNDPDFPANSRMNSRTVVSSKLNISGSAHAITGDTTPSQSPDEFDIFSEELPMDVLPISAVPSAALPQPELAINQSIDLAASFDDDPTPVTEAVEGSPIPADYDYSDFEYGQSVIAMEAVAAVPPAPQENAVPTQAVPVTAPVTADVPVAALSMGAAAPVRLTPMPPLVTPLAPSPSVSDYESDFSSPTPVAPLPSNQATDAVGADPSYFRSYDHFDDDISPSNIHTPVHSPRQDSQLTAELLNMIPMDAAALAFGRKGVDTSSSMISNAELVVKIPNHDHDVDSTFGDTYFSAPAAGGSPGFQNKLEPLPESPATESNRTEPKADTKFVVHNDTTGQHNRGLTLEMLAAIPMDSYAAMREKMYKPSSSMASSGELVPAVALHVDGFHDDLHDDGIYPDSPVAPPQVPLSGDSVPLTLEVLKSIPAHDSLANRPGFAGSDDSMLPRMSDTESIGEDAFAHHARQSSLAAPPPTPAPEAVVVPSSGGLTWAMLEGLPSDDAVLGLQRQSSSVFNDDVVARQHEDFDLDAPQDPASPQLRASHSDSERVSEGGVRLTAELLAHLPVDSAFPQTERADSVLVETSMLHHEDHAIDIMSPFAEEQEASPPVPAAPTVTPTDVDAPMEDVFAVRGLLAPMPDAVVPTTGDVAAIVTERITPVVDNDAAPATESAVLPVEGVAAPLAEVSSPTPVIADSPCPVLAAPVVKEAEDEAEDADTFADSPMDHDVPRFSLTVTPAEDAPAVDKTPFSVSNDMLLAVPTDSILQTFMRLTKNKIEEPEPMPPAFFRMATRDIAIELPPHVIQQREEEERNRSDESDDILDHVLMSVPFSSAAPPIAEGAEDETVTRVETETVAKPPADAAADAPHAGEDEPTHVHPYVVYHSESKSFTLEYPQPVTVEEDSVEELPQVAAAATAKTETEVVGTVDASEAVSTHPYVVYHAETKSFTLEQPQVVWEPAVVETGSQTPASEEVAAVNAPPQVIYHPETKSFSLKKHQSSVAAGATEELDKATEEVVSTHNYVVYHPESKSFTLEQPAGQREAEATESIAEVTQETFVSAPTPAPTQPYVVYHSKNESFTLEQPTAAVFAAEEASSVVDSISPAPPIVYYDADVKSFGLKQNDTIVMTPNPNITLLPAPTPTPAAETVAAPVGAPVVSEEKAPAPSQGRDALRNLFEALMADDDDFGFPRLMSSKVSPTIAPFAESGAEAAATPVAEPVAEPTFEPLVEANISIPVETEIAVETPAAIAVVEADTISVAAPVRDLLEDIRAAAVAYEERYSAVHAPREVSQEVHDLLSAIREHRRAEHARKTGVLDTASAVAAEAVGETQETLLADIIADTASSTSSLDLSFDAETMSDRANVMTTYHLTELRRIAVLHAVRFARHAPRALRKMDGDVARQLRAVAFLHGLRYVTALKSMRRGDPALMNEIASEGKRREQLRELSPSDAEAVAHLSPVAKDETQARSVMDLLDDIQRAAHAYEERYNATHTSPEAFDDMAAFLHEIKAHFREKEAQCASRTAAQVQCEEQYEDEEWETFELPAEASLDMSFDLDAAERAGVMTTYELAELRHLAVLHALRYVKHEQCALKRQPLNQNLARELRAAAFLHGLRYVTAHKAMRKGDPALLAEIASKRHEEVVSEAEPTTAAAVIEAVETVEAVTPVDTVIVAVVKPAIVNSTVFADAESAPELGAAPVAEVTEVVAVEAAPIVVGTMEAKAAVEPEVAVAPSTAVMVVEAEPEPVGADALVDEDYDFANDFDEFMYPEDMEAPMSERTAVNAVATSADTPAEVGAQEASSMEAPVAVAEHRDETQVAPLPALQAKASLVIVDGTDATMADVDISSANEAAPVAVSLAEQAKVPADEPSVTPVVPLAADAPVEAATEEDEMFVVQSAETGAEPIAAEVSVVIPVDASVELTAVEAASAPAAEPASQSAGKSVMDTADVPSVEPVAEAVTAPIVAESTAVLAPPVSILEPVSAPVVDPPTELPTAESLFLADGDLDYEMLENSPFFDEDAHEVPAQETATVDALVVATSVEEPVNSAAMVVDANAITLEPTTTPAIATPKVDVVAEVSASMEPPVAPLASSQVADVTVTAEAEVKKTKEVESVTSPVELAPATPLAPAVPAVESVASSVAAAAVPLPSARTLPPISARSAAPEYLEATLADMAMECVAIAAPIHTAVPRVVSVSLSSRSSPARVFTPSSMSGQESARAVSRGPLAPIARPPSQSLAAPPSALAARSMDDAVLTRPTAKSMTSRDDIDAAIDVLEQCDDLETASTVSLSQGDLTRVTTYKDTSLPCRIPASPLQLGTQPLARRTTPSAQPERPPASSHEPSMFAFPALSPLTTRQTSAPVSTPTSAPAPAPTAVAVKPVLSAAGSPIHRNLSLLKARQQANANSSLPHIHASSVDTLPSDSTHDYLSPSAAKRPSSPAVHGNTPHTPHRLPTRSPQRPLVSPSLLRTTEAFRQKIMAPPKSPYKSRTQDVTDQLSPHTSNLARVFSATSQGSGPRSPSRGVPSQDRVARTVSNLVNTDATGSRGKDLYDTRLELLTMKKEYNSAVEKNKTLKTEVQRLTSQLQQQTRHLKALQSELAIVRHNSPIRPNRLSPLRPATPLTATSSFLPSVDASPASAESVEDKSTAAWEAEKKELVYQLYMLQKQLSDAQQQQQQQSASVPLSSIVEEATPASVPVTASAAVPIVDAAAVAMAVPVDETVVTEAKTAAQFAEETTMEEPEPERLPADETILMRFSFRNLFPLLSSCMKRCSVKLTQQQLPLSLTLPFKPYLRAYLSSNAQVADADAGLVIEGTPVASPAAFPIPAAVVQNCAARVGPCSDAVPAWLVCAIDYAKAASAHSIVFDRQPCPVVAIWGRRKDEVGHTVQESLYISDANVELHEVCVSKKWETLRVVVYDVCPEFGPQDADVLATISIRMEHLQPRCAQELLLSDWQKTPFEEVVSVPEKMRKRYYNIEKVLGAIKNGTNAKNVSPTLVLSIE